MNKKTPSPYITSFDAVITKQAENPVINIRLVASSEFDDINTRACASHARQMEQGGFTGKDKQFCVLRNDTGEVTDIYAGTAFPLSLYTLSSVFEKIRAEFSSNFLSSVSFALSNDLNEDEATKAAIGWMLASYRFDVYKKDKNKSVLPVLVWPAKAHAVRALATAEGLCLLKTLINMPPNILGTDELADAAAHVAKLGKAQFSRIIDKDLIDKNFPMIYEVGKASPRRPQIVEFSWGDSSHPAVTLVGKGIVFDTGGLDLKPPAFMLLMKKDMGGAAHVLGLAHIIMSLKLPVCLRVILSVAENAVGGAAFRPGDIIQSRKGLSVEVSDTDAEGRLVVGDALTYACEGERPKLLVDFCTLTGSARAALGYDIPAFFSNRDALQESLKNHGAKCEDPVWPLPLHQPYLKEMNSSVADINNIGSGKAGAIHGALFLQQFIDNDVDWIHLDCYAWEQSGKAGRPQGGADTGLRSVLALIEEKFCV